MDERLVELLALPADWDSYGAQPISPAVAAYVQACLDALARLGTDVRGLALVPEGNGGIGIILGFDGPGGLELSFSVGVDDV
jgi:hypothetical protein